MTCLICNGKEKENLVYENDNIIIMLAENPSISGHLQIFTKRHVTIMEQLSQEESDYIIGAANKVSIILFEALKVHGTNIVVQNGIPAGQTTPHFSVHIIPRRTDDGLSLDWDMKQASNESLDSIQRLISEGIDFEDNKTALHEEHEEKPADTMREDIVNENSDNNEEDTTSSRLKKNEESHRNIDKKSNHPEKKTNYWLKSLERIP